MSLQSQSPSLSAEERARRQRVFAAIAEARVHNAWLRLGASAIAAAIGAGVFGKWSPLVWLGGLVLVIATDRAMYRRMLRESQAGAVPARLAPLAMWTAFQAAYGNTLAVILWFAPHPAGQTLATIFLCGGLANAAATLRRSPTLSVASVSSGVGMLIGLPILEFLMEGSRDIRLLSPTIGAILLVAWGVKLWQSLVASDVAQAQAEAAAIRERQSAAAAAAAKSDMIRRVNDELRTPMAVLAGAAEYLSRSAVSPQARAQIGMLTQAGEVLRLALEDLSDLDRLENGQLSIAPAAADPRALARGVVNAFRAAAQDKHLELFLDVAAQTPALVEIDARRVRQVLFNLLANAVSYTQHGGVRVRVGVELGGGDGRVRLKFSIADTGAGLSRSQLALIFRGKGESAEMQGALGLAISLRLAALMGGKITASSELGSGSVFALILEAPVLERAGASKVA